MAVRSAKSSIDRKSLLRYVRIAVYLACVGIIFYGTRGLRLIEVPPAARALYDFAPGQTVFAADLGPDEPLAAGDAVMYFKTRERIEFGRVVALAGDVLEHDAATQRTRRAGETTWYPWPGDGAPAAPASDQVLVLAENPAHRDSGGLVNRRVIAARLVVAVPW
jgi:hypothetical protein